MTAYTLRHTCASWLVALDAPVRKIAELLGISEAKIIKHYGHLAPDYQDEAANAFARRERFSGESVGRNSGEPERT